MELTGHACTEALSGAEEAERRERSQGNAGGVRVELGVRALTTFDDVLQTDGELTHRILGSGSKRLSQPYLRQGSASNDQRW